MDNLETKVNKEQNKMKNKQSFTTDYIFMSDFHAPIYDKKAVGVLTRVVNDIKPANMIFGGDEIDAHYLSKYDHSAQKMSFQQEVDSFIKNIFIPLYNANPNANYKFVASNHSTARLKKFLDESPAFHGMRMLSYENILKESMNKYMKTVPDFSVSQEVLIKYRNKPIYLFKHGNKANMNTPRAELQLENMSGMSGHKHSYGMYSITDRQGTHTWNTVGHLSDVSEQNYMKALTNGHPNWTLGFGYVRQYKNLMIPQNVLITKKNNIAYCVVNDILYSSKDKLKK